MTTPRRGEKGAYTPEEYFKAGWKTTVSTGDQSRASKAAGGLIVPTTGRMLNEEETKRHHELLAARNAAEVQRDAEIARRSATRKTSADSSSKSTPQFRPLTIRSPINATTPPSPTAATKIRSNASSINQSTLDGITLAPPARSMRSETKTLVDPGPETVPDKKKLSLSEWSYHSSDYDGQSSRDIFPNEENQKKQDARREKQRRERES